MLNYDRITFDYEPFPICMAHSALDAKIYQELMESFPPINLFEFKSAKGVKYSLSQVNNGAKYRRFLAGSPSWKAFHAYIKSPAFINEALTMLKAHGLDLGFPSPGLGEQLYLKMRALKRGNPVPHFPKLKARFEFSAMPVTGGNILPHTDHPKKIITMVIPMLRAGEWLDAWGGGTVMVWPKDKTRIFNRVNGYLDFGDVECVKTFPFEPNQCLVFIKTNNSWHAVFPMTGDDPKILRKTLTINIESS
ncbi:MAG: hypothetical protein ACU0DI_01350 [Paracoccaceae bacterium]